MVRKTLLRRVNSAATSTRECRTTKCWERANLDRGWGGSVRVPFTRARSVIGIDHISGPRDIHRERRKVFGVLPDNSEHQAGFLPVRVRSLCDFNKRTRGIDWSGEVSKMLLFIRAANAARMWSRTQTRTQPPRSGHAYARLDARYLNAILFQTRRLHNLNPKQVQVLPFNMCIRCAITFLNIKMRWFALVY